MADLAQMERRRRAILRAYPAGSDFRIRYLPERHDALLLMRQTQKSDHPGYSCEKTHWVFVTGVEPLNYCPADYLIGFRRDVLKTTFNNRRNAHTMRTMCAHRQHVCGTMGHKRPQCATRCHVIPF